MQRVAINGVDPIDFGQPPYVFDDVTTICFELQLGTMQYLQQVCDKFLNEPLKRRPQKEGHFKPQNDVLLLTFSDFPRVTSPFGIAEGFLAYREVSLTFPVFEHGSGRVSYFAPVLFLDGPGSSHARADWQTVFPIVVGRELFGLPKTRGEIDFSFGFDFSGFPGPGVDIGGVRSTTPDRGALELQRFIGIETGAGPVMPSRLKTARQPLRANVSAARGWHSALLGLRQVHDPRDITKVSHREVIRTTFTVNDPLPSPAIGRFNVRINPVAYPGLATELGLGEHYAVDGHNVFVFRGVNAVFAEPAETEIYTP